MPLRYIKIVKKNNKDKIETLKNIINEHNTTEEYNIEYLLAKRI